MERPRRRRHLMAILVTALALGATALVVGAALELGARHDRSAERGRSLQSTQDAGPVATGARPAPIVYRPPGLSRAQRVPLVVALYGDGGCPQCMDGLTKFEHLAAEHGFVVAYPGSSTSPPWNAPDDVSFIGSLIDQVKVSENIDPLRVYVTGFSAGGRMAYQLGCSLSGKLAAIAVVSSIMRSYPCPLSHPVSELTLDGSTETVAISGNSNGIPPAASTAARWRALDGCPSSVADSVSQVGPARQDTWGPCADGSSVALYILAGGHHTWPGTYGLSPSDPDAQYNASEAIWSFFAAHPATSLTKPAAQVLRVGSKRRRLVATLRLGEPVAVQGYLTTGGRSRSLGSVRLATGASVPLVLAVPRKLKRGRYQVKLKISDMYGRILVIVRRVRF